MRIKFNDKIYRLKEIESGVDSLMELVEEPKYKDGDYVYEDGRIMIVKSYPNIYHVNSWPIYSDKLSYNGIYAVNFSAPTFRYATAKEKQKLNELLKKDNKRWNTEKKCIEDVPVYKDGDFVVNDLDAILIFKEADGDRISDHAYLPVYGELVIDRVVSCKGIKRYATTEEKQRIIDALAERGKRWNEDKKCIETIPTYKNGDFLRTKLGNLFIFKEIKRISYEKEYSAFCHFFTSVSSNYKGYGLNKNGVCFEKDIDRYCTPEERQKILDDLAKDGKRWNADKKCIENIPRPKFKAGDKVKIKDGISSETQGCVYPYFEDFLDQYMGKVMTVKEYITTDIGEYITTSEAKRGDHHFGFAEDWLEPWNDEPKVGDWVVAWGDDSVPVVGVLDKIYDEYFKYRYSVGGIKWQNIIKFDGTVEQFKKVMKGEI